jgi:hypothetical protein
VERGRRIPRPEYLDRADEVLSAGGRIAALKEDLAEVRYPKKVRDLKKLEADAVELGAYNNSVIHGLLQTEEYIRASVATRRPPFSVLRSPTTSSNNMWQLAWLDRASSAGRRHFASSASCSANRRYAVPSAAEW